MAIIRDDAVVLGRLDYSETSQIMVLFTREHGKVRAIAKGIKRGTRMRFAAGVDLLDVGKVVISSRHERSATLATITEWTQTKSLSGLRERLFRIHGAEYMAEVTGHLTEDWDPHGGLFDALLSSLAALSEASEPLGATVAYQLQLVEAVGSKPRFDVCVRCGRSSDLTHFSSFEGGMICRHCEPAQIEKWEVSPAALGFLRTSRSRSLAEPRVLTRAGPRRLKPAARENHGSLAAVFELLNYHIAHLMGREPRLASKVLPPGQRPPA